MPSVYEIHAAVICNMAFVIESGNQSGWVMLRVNGTIAIGDDPAKAERRRPNRRRVLDMLFGRGGVHSSDRSGGVADGSITD